MSKLFSLLFFILTVSGVTAQEKDLDYYINAGVTNSPLLKEFFSQTKSNLIDSERIAAGYKPQVNGASTNSYAPVINGYGYEGAITNVGNFNELISVSKQLVSKQNLQNQYNTIKLLNDSVQIAGKISDQDLKRAITVQYITAYGSWQQYSFNKDVYELLSKADTILKKLTQAGVYRQTDYLTFLVTLQQQSLAIMQAKIQFQNEFATLNYLSGIFDTSFTPLAEPALQPYNILPLESTVFYKKYTIDSLLLDNAHKQIDFNYKPKVSLYADAGYVSTLTYQAYKNFGTSFGINLNVPIYDGRQKQMQHRQLTIAEQTRQNYRDYFKTQYSQQLAQLMQQLQSTQQLIDETNNQLKYVEALIQANAKLLATGDVRIADYVIAISNYLNAKNISTQNTISKLQLIVQINYWNRK